MSDEPPRFLVSVRADNVGVAVSAIGAGESARGLVLGDGATLIVRALEAIPFGHKLALVALEPGDEVRRYGRPLGRVTRAIAAGAHVHVHNLVTSRF